MRRIANAQLTPGVRISTEFAVEFAHSIFYCGLLLITFLGILWTLSGTITVPLGAYSFELGGYMVWAALLYSGLGSTLIVEGIVHPLELGHLPYRKGTFEDYVGLRGLQKRGKKKWRRTVDDVVIRLAAAVQPDTVVIGGGNVKKLKTLPPGCRTGLNANAFRGGFRLWGHAPAAKRGLR